MNDLQLEIEKVLAQADVNQLKIASQHLSIHYRSGLSLIEEKEILAYLVVRLPATYAAIRSVLGQVSTPGSILDLGAGPGTVAWAARAAWETAPPITAVEREGAFIALGQKLGSDVTWLQRDLLAIPSFTPHDWVVFGYSLGEIEEKERPPLLNKCWPAAKKGIILIEPGTPRGNQTILQARSHLVSLGGSVFAPCPHSRPCPLQAPSWCHFSVRLERSFLHRLAKTALLPYEDEKFSYVIVTKEPPSLPLSRVIHSPQHRSGHTHLSLCTPDGLQSLTLSRRHKEAYRRARKISWGDPFQVDN